MQPKMSLMNPNGLRKIGLKIGCGGSQPPIPNTSPLHAESAEIGPNQGLATTYTEHVSITRGIANNPYWKPDPTVAPCQPFASPP